MSTKREQDAFDRLYSRWADNALDKRLDPPSRQRWDEAVLFLLLSEDPERVARYMDIGLGRGESLGSDAYELWRKMPDYMPNRVVKVKNQRELKEYEAVHVGSMRDLMQRRGLGELYDALMLRQAEFDRVRREKAKRAQSSVMIMGCAGMGAIVLMMLAVGLVIALQLTAK